MPPVPDSLIAELELAVKGDSPDNRTKTLRRVTDLFLNDAERLNDDQIKVFDDVLCLLVRRIEHKALVELSKRLAPVDNSPLEVIRRLAQDQEIDVAGRCWRSRDGSPRAISSKLPQPEAKPICWRSPGVISSTNL
jgi:hypothetical protein